MRQQTRRQKSVTSRLRSHLSKCQQMPFMWFLKVKNSFTRIRHGPKQKYPSINSWIFGMFLFGHWGTNFRRGSNGFTRVNGQRVMTVIIRFGPPQGPRVLSSTRKCVSSVVRCIICQYMDALLSATNPTHWCKLGLNHGRYLYKPRSSNGEQMPIREIDLSWANCVYQSIWGNPSKIGRSHGETQG